MRTQFLVWILAGFFSLFALFTPPPVEERSEPGARGRTAPTAPSSADVLKTAAGAIFGEDIIAMEEGGVCMIFAPGTPVEYMEKRMHRMRELADAMGFETTNSWNRFSSSRLPVSLTYSFPADGVTLGGVPETENANFMNARWNEAFSDRGGEAFWKQKFRESFDTWEAVTGNQYTQAPDQGGAWPNTIGPHGGGDGGDIRIVSAVDDGPSGTLAFNFFPTNGDMLLDSADLERRFADPEGDFIYLRNTVMHEIGHGMGLLHSCPNDRTKLMEPFIRTNFNGPQLDDLLGMQSLYGDPLEPNNATIVASPPSDTGFLPDASADVFLMSVNPSFDQDFYRISVSRPSILDAGVAPRSGAVLAGPQLGADCPTPDGGFQSFDVAEQADLRLDILDAEGNVILTQDENGLGAGESIQGFALPRAGDFFIRVEAGEWNDIQMYGLSVTLTGGGCPGDLSGDGVIDGADLGILLGAWGSVGSPADLNNDGVVDGADLSSLLGCWG